MIRGIHHVGMTTPDIDRLVRFYVEALGFEEVSRGGWEVGNATTDAIVGLHDSAASTAFLRTGNVMIEMFQYHSPPGAPNVPDRPANDAGFTHICLEVTDIDAEYERLTALGMTFNGPVSHTSSGMAAVYGRDPDGNYVEILEFEKPIPKLDVDYPTDAATT